MCKHLLFTGKLKIKSLNLYELFTDVYTSIKSTKMEFIPILTKKKKKKKEEDKQINK